jgi:hypothetical protein
MATTAPGLYVKISQRIWSNEALHTVTKGARASWFMLWCWAADQGEDGRVTKPGRRSCDVTDQEIAELTEVGLLIEANGELLLVEWDSWNMTAEEIEAARKQKSAAGKKGAAAKHGHELAAAEPVTATAGPLIDTNVDGLTVIALAERINAAWPAPSPGWKAEAVKKIAEAVQHVDSEQGAALVEFLNEALALYYATRTTEPKARTYLASPSSKIEKFIEAHASAAEAA